MMIVATAITRDATMTDTAHRDGNVSAPGLPTLPRLSLNSPLALTGPVLVALPCLLAALLGMNTYAPYGADAAFGIAVGAAAVVAMAQTLILAARPPLVEPLFGGLDRMYRVHKWLGISAMVLMILHQQIEPDFERLVRETSLGDLGEGGRTCLQRTSRPSRCQLVPEIALHRARDSLSALAVQPSFHGSPFCNRGVSPVFCRHACWGRPDIHVGAECFRHRRSGRLDLHRVARSAPTA